MSDILCKHCDHFVSPNPCYGDSPGLARYIHEDDGGDWEYDHDATPGLGEPPEGWETSRPDLFVKHPDKAIGPNSRYHSHKGKLWALSEE